MEATEDSTGQKELRGGRGHALTHTHAHAQTHTFHGSQRIAANESLVHRCAYSHYCVPETWSRTKFTQTQTHRHTQAERRTVQSK